MKHIFFALLVVIATVGCVDDEKEKEIEARIDSQILTNWLTNEEYKQVWKYLDVPLRNQFGSFTEFQNFAIELNEQLGEKTSKLDLHIFVYDDLRYAETIARYKNLPDGNRAAFLWVMNSNKDENVEQLSFRIVPEEASSEFSYTFESKTEYSLPFEGEMVVLWGGDSTFLNYHADTNAQRYAIDFLAFEDGRYFTGTGTNNEDHFCWGLPISAPASGRVVSVARAIEDNNVGEENSIPEEYLGNHVVLDHFNGEFSVLAHLRQNTVNIALGEFVTSGQFIGECGNSGLSDIPHLHFHIQDSPDYLDIVGSQGIPPTFHSIYINDDFKNTAKIERGDKVSKGKN
ncbi:M23 family metallopeptidase [Pseudoalteromonas sp. H105]|uniref:M23 family metallopeptidase n=1 Tax=Pseudoalteromonas sp. H105 TaxID=1348393 RepID=UPI0007323B65|nr:M23 family metallopeptidase [Pseudoalteromonas sp. H105]KTF13705.1 hypothetical protein ATS75_14125 [Pseudoalteromonas sp. H105]